MLASPTVLDWGWSIGLYLVGTGSTGVAEALMTMGAAYFTIMLTAALTLKRPAPGYVPEGYTPSAAEGMSVPTELWKAMSALHRVNSCPVLHLCLRGLSSGGLDDADSVEAPSYSLPEVMKKKEFYLLLTTMFCIASGGMGLLSVAKPMMSDVFASNLPAVVTSTFASSYVLMLSMGNLGGRLGWGAFSDKFGRPMTFHIFTLGSIPLFMLLPSMIEHVVSSGSPLAL